MKAGLYVLILGILGIIIGAAFIVAKYHHTIGTIGAILGVVLVIIGAGLWMMKEKTAPMPAAATTQPAKTP